MAKILVQELVTPGCQICAIVKKFFEEKLKPAHPDIEVEYIDALGQHGQELLAKHGIFASPAIFINGELFSVGGLDETKFLEKIKELR